MARKTTVDDYLAATSSDAMTEDNLSKVTVYLTDGSVRAMDLASETTGDSRTDTINRALHVYAALVAIEAGGTISFDLTGDGTRRQVAVVK